MSPTNAVCTAAGACGVHRIRQGELPFGKRIPIQRPLALMGYRLPSSGPLIISKILSSAGLRNVSRNSFDAEGATPASHSAAKPNVDLIRVQQWLRRSQHRDTDLVSRQDVT
jgi:hypothetical protein